MSDDMKPDDKPIDDRFYIVTYERGRETDSLPTWANAGSNAIAFEDRASTDICRVDIDGVPGAFQILNVLTTSECDQFVQLTESMGYHADSPVSLPHSIRHNHNVNWVVDESVDGTIWTRCEALMGPGASGAQALGINARFRFYRYEKGDHFKLHTDGAWPGSRIVERRLLQDAYGDRQSEMTFLLFLSDGYQGGRTLFYLKNGTGDDVVAISTPKGAALCFPHGYHPQHCLHAGETVGAGVKYIIRSDVLYPL